MSLQPPLAYFSECQPLPALALPWFAIRTRSNFEKTTSAVLGSKGYEQYLPLYSVKRRWSDRVVETHLPLFPGYVFCRFDPKARVPILSAPGVVAIIGFGTEPAPIPDQEIEAIQTVLNSGLAAEPCPFLREGQRVRIKHGSMAGVEGILTKKKNDLRMVVSVTMLQRSVSVEIDNASIATI
ncbi:MAG TPA: UpxY family transcription antiterminator [Bryobacteraceae bacterium]|jgi:transcription antitermination factor NusG|nr:UpxY family transcription antiterminator [Bryobacteraceae bacterium]